MQPKLTENEIATQIVDIAYQVHKRYGPGLLESVYQEIMCYELTKRGLFYTSEEAVPLVHDGIMFKVGFRADIIVERKVIVELKSIELLASVHFKQMTTYVKLSRLRLGLLINFNVALIKDGIHRIVNGLPE